MEWQYFRGYWLPKRAPLRKLARFWLIQRKAKRHRKSSGRRAHHISSKVRRLPSPVSVDSAIRRDVEIRAVCIVYHIDDLGAVRDFAILICHPAVGGLMHD